MTFADRFEGCILAGAIGDAYGSAYENQKSLDEKTFYLFGKPEPKILDWRLTDDTQLTLATCEALIEDINVSPETFVEAYLKLYRKNRITGIGASTLKSLKELDFGMDWSVSGNRGEYAAGNGAAMRIAPLAFIKDVSKEKIRNICSITHNNDEAYVGALAIIVCLKAILNKEWVGESNLIEIVIDEIPDTRLRDRLVEIDSKKNKDRIEEIGRLGNDGYVVNSVPLAIASAQLAPSIGIRRMYESLRAVGGDTDTNCSMAGQIAGTLLGADQIPNDFKNSLMKLKEYNWINTTIRNFIDVIGRS
ncbi:MAG: ADP-ribosylglycohydrolase family protein [Bacteroidota bacterium]